MHRTEGTTKPNALVVLTVHTMNYLHAGHHGSALSKHYASWCSCTKTSVPPESIAGLSVKEVAPFKSEYDVWPG